MAKSAKKVAKKSVKKAAKIIRTPAQLAKHAETRETILHLLMRKMGATLQDLKDAGHKQPAMAALKMAETRGLKTKTDKPDGEFTRYFATGTLTKPVRKVAAKKAVKKAAPKKKATAPRKAKAKKAPSTNGSEATSIEAAV